MENNKKRLIIIDSNSLIYRAYYALPLFENKNKEIVGAIYGFLLAFFKMIKDFQPDFVVATFDLPAPTFRHKKYKEYKANRPPTPKEIYRQIPKIREILKIFNVPILEKEGFEADDVIGTIVNLVSNGQSRKEIETIILSSDSDVFQLVNDQIKVYALKRGIKNIILYDKELVKEKFEGLLPEQLLDFKALTGDPSDNIPGVPGIGRKIATKLIKEFGTIESLYQKIENTEYKMQPSLKAKLVENKEKAFLSKMLIRIKIDTPIDFSLRESVWGNYNKEEVIKILEKFGFHSLVKKFLLLNEINSSKNNLINIVSQNKLF
jgi:DNA polymerase-1